MNARAHACAHLRTCTCTCVYTVCAHVYRHVFILVYACVHMCVDTGAHTYAHRHPLSLFRGSRCTELPGVYPRVHLIGCLSVTAAGYLNSRCTVRRFDGRRRCEALHRRVLSDAAQNLSKKKDGGPARLRRYSAMSAQNQANTRIHRTHVRAHIHAERQSMAAYGAEQCHTGICVCLLGLFDAGIL